MTEALERQAEYLQVVKALSDCLDNEWRLAIALDTQGLLENTHLKSQLQETLLSHAKRFQELNIADAELERAFEGLSSRCARNQRFLRHSLRNLDFLFSHLRRCFGENPRYSPKGERLENPSTGKVLEVSY